MQRTKFRVMERNEADMTMNEMKKEDNYDDDIVLNMTLIKDVFKGIRKFWWIAIILTLISIGSMTAYKIVTYKPMYQSKASFMIATSIKTEQSEETYGFSFDAGNASMMARTFPYILSSSAMQDVLKKNLKTDVINGTIMAYAIEETNVFSLYVTSNRPEDAYKIAQAVIEHYPEIARYVIGDSKLTMIQKPSIPKKPYNKAFSSESLVKSGIAGIIVWLLFVIIYAVTRSTIRKEEDISKKLNKYCFGSIPVIKNKHRKGRNVGTVFLDNIERKTGFHENMNRIATRITKDMKNTGDKILMVTSALPNEGKSTFAVNLAAVLSKRNLNVLLINADLIKQRLESFVDQEDLKKGGLVEYFKGKVSEEDIICHSEILHCDVIKGGVLADHSAAEILSSATAGNLIKHMKETYDCIILDTPPCQILSDAVEISRYADAAVFVIRYDYTKSGQIIEGMGNLYDSKIRIMGCVLNDVPIQEAAYGYGSYRYGSYGYYGKNE